MRELARDLWVAERSLRFAGAEIGARMTVLRVPGRRLLVHSPIPLSEPLLAQVSGLGTVNWIVAPNRFHHLSVGDWRDAFPEAQLVVARGLEEKRPDLADGLVLSPEGRFEIEGIEIEVVQGVPMTNETVFFHRASGTLVLADLAFNLGPEAPPFTRVLFRLIGGYGRLAPTAMEKLMVRDRVAFSQSLRRILSWPFGRVIVAHGTVKESGGRKELAANYAWALKSPVS